MKKSNKKVQIEQSGSFVLVFDMPRSMQTERRILNRELHRAGAKRVQDSFWKLNDLDKLMQIAMHIRNIGGHAEILEEKFLF